MQKKYAKPSRREAPMDLHYSYIHIFTHTHTFVYKFGELLKPTKRFGIMV